MSKLMEGNKRYLFWVVVIGLFGIVGLLMVPIVKCIIRVSERHPKACRWIIIVAFISITIYQFIEQGWISGFGWICIGVVLATNSMFKDIATLPFATPTTTRKHLASTKTTLVLAEIAPDRHFPLAFV